MTCTVPNSSEAKVLPPLPAPTFEFKQFYMGCLAQASYLLGSDGEAAIVDPRRDVDMYIDEAKAAGLAIRYVIETHLHADFVSGHRELAERTGATILISHRASAAFPHQGVRDGDSVKVGGLSLRFLETPGHTPESISVLVTDMKASDRPQMVLTGDTLFIGDVGRPDLLGGKGITAEHMAGLLYDSLHTKLLPLADDVLVYPGHGAGSLCGKNLSKDTFSTIGRQRETNVALQPMDREEFIRFLTKDAPEIPRYFPMDVEINRRGAPSLEPGMKPKPLGAAEFKRLRQEGAVVLDVRASGDYARESVPQSLNIGLGGQFASWAGTLLDVNRDLVIVAQDEAGASEARTRLARVGLEQTASEMAQGRAVDRFDHQPDVGECRNHDSSFRKSISSGTLLPGNSISHPSGLRSRTTLIVSGLPTLTGTSVSDAFAAAMVSFSLLRQRWKALSLSPLFAQYSRCVRSLRTQFSTCSRQ